MKLRGAEIAQVTWRSHRSQLEALRTQVFIEEQAVPSEDEWDGLDELSIHFIATSRTFEPIGCVRLTPSGQIGRLAVLASERRQGIGRLLMEAVIKAGLNQGVGPLHLHAQLHAIALYQSLGFEVTGSEFIDAGIPHVPMQLVHDASRSDRLATYNLGEAELAPRENAVTEVDPETFAREISWDGAVVQDDVLGDSDAIRRDHFLITRDDETVGGAILSMTGEVLFFSSTLEASAGRVLLNAIIAKAVRYRWSSLTIAEHRSLPPALATDWQPSDIHSGRLELSLDSNPKHLHPIHRDSSKEPPLAEATLGGIDHNYWFSNHQEITELLRKMASLASREILLHSPTLLSEWAFDEAFCLEVSRLARSHGSTRVQILVWDVMPLVQQNAPLLELSRKLSSSIQIKLVSPAFQSHPGEFAVIDQKALFIQQDPHHPIGWANFRATAKAREKRRLFLRLWENGLSDANLRQMHL